MIQFINSVIFMLKKIKCISTIDYTNTLKWIWLIRLLQFIGQLPITTINNNITKNSREAIASGQQNIPDNIVFNKKEEQQLLRFNFKVISKITAYAICIGLLRISLVWTLVGELRPCKHTAENNMTSFSVTVDIICPISYYSVPVLINMEWLCSIFTVGYFCRFLNNWDKFNQLKIFTTANRYQPTTNTSNHSILLSFIAFLSIFTLNLTGCILFYIQMNRGFIFLFECFLAHTAAFLEDLRLGLMFISIATGYQKIRLAVIQVLKQEPQMQNFPELSPCKCVNKLMLCNSLSNTQRKIFLQKCQQAIRVAKEQAELTEAYGSLYQVLYILFVTFGLTAGIFHFTAAILQGQTVGYLNSATQFIWFGVSCGRLFLKCYLAEKITVEEKRIADELIDLDTTELAICTRFEVKNLSDWIIMNTTKITFGSIFRMNNRLLITIGSQMLTFLIILLQFQQNSNSF